MKPDNAPTEKETQYAQVEGLIRHLLDDHSICWSDVCWIKDNPELQLQSPTLKNCTKTEIENFRSVITTIFRVPSGQSLVTTLRTSDRKSTRLNSSHSQISYAVFCLKKKKKKKK